MNAGIIRQLKAGRFLKDSRGGKLNELSSLRLTLRPAICYAIGNSCNIVIIRKILRGLLITGIMINKKTSSLQDDPENKDRAALSEEEEEREIDLFIENSHKYCRKEFGRIFEDENEIKDLKDEMKQSNKAVKQIRTEWGLT